MTTQTSQDGQYQSVSLTTYEQLVVSGVIQEANRRFFHPLGLQLIAMPTTQSGPATLTVLSAGDDLEGFYMPTVDPKHVQLIDLELELRRPHREAYLGSLVQTNDYQEPKE